MPASAAELMMMDGEANMQTPFSGQNGSRSARWIIFRLLSSFIKGQHLNPASWREAGSLAQSFEYHRYTVVCL